jgi:hypothetical protein
MSTSDSKRELLELCDRMLDGQLTVEDRDRLESSFWAMPNFANSMWK